MFQFADNLVVVPIIVPEEIDQFKKAEPSDRGRSAVKSVGGSDDLRKGQSPADGVTLPSGASVGGARIAPGKRRFA